MSKYQAAPRERVPDQLRGIAALMVAAFHCILPFYAQLQAVLPAPLFHGLFALCNGSAGVVLFFVLSGYVLMPSLERMGKQGHVAPRFVLRRLFRIVPLWWLSVGIGMLLLLLFPGARLPGDLSASLTLQPGWTLLWQNLLFGQVQLNPVGWTLQIELLAVPLLYLAWTLCRHPLARCALFGLTVGLLYRYLLTPLLPGMYFFQFAFMFVLGSGLHYLLPWLHGHSTAGVRQRIAAAVLPLGVMLWVLPSSKSLAQLVPGYFLASGCGATLVLAAALSLPWPSGRASRWLAQLGEISYGFYLLHRLCLVALALGLLTIAPTLASHPFRFSGLLLLTSFPLALLLAAPLFRWFERPAMAAGRAFEQRCFKLDSRKSDAYV
ncbi:acyltransferase family protein [Chitinimonas sp.]|uniref:acyltransferase family protein n=1 Tax=Chitinimonas sp. TaxID=1934313 RepID=UPI0035B01D44